MAAVTAVLARYPKEVITAVTHPVTGIVVEIKWLPSVMEVREACERSMRPIRNALEHERLIAAQFEERRREDEAKAHRPTREELEAKYGKDWGLTSLSPQKEAVRVSAPPVDQLRHHYQHYDMGFKPKNHRDLEEHIDRGFSPGTTS